MVLFHMLISGLYETTLHDSESSHDGIVADGINRPSEKGSAPDKGYLPSVALASVPSTPLGCVDASKKRW